MALNIWVDQNIPLGKEVFSQWGDVTLYEGRSLTSRDLAKTDVLLVRSVTKIRQGFLDQTPVKFVGTATAGVDHIDADYLKAQSVLWTNAPGSNARSVAEYSLAAWIQLGVIDQISKLGIWGYGHVGKEVHDVFAAIGCEIKASDPFLSAEEFNALVNESDMFDVDAVSLHMPYTQNCEHPTKNKIDKEWLSQLKPNTHFLNAGRGEVVVEKDFLNWKKLNPKSEIVLDVFWDEPKPSAEILQSASIATPHIAGYSYTGKVRGTRMLEASLANWLAESLNSSDEAKTKYLVSESKLSYKEAVLKVYNPIGDHQRFMGKGPEEAIVNFDRLRKEYPKRLEFSDCCVRPASSADADKLSGLGFTLD